MSLENASWGAGGGIIGGTVTAILSAMGLKDRVKRLEREKVEKEVFELFQNGLNQRLTNIERMLEKLINGK